MSGDLRWRENLRLQVEQMGPDAAIDREPQVFWVDRVRSFAETYGDGTHELHVHFMWQTHEFCATSRRGSFRERVSTFGELPCGIDVPDAGSIDTPHTHQEPAMLVGVVEGFEDGESVVLCRSLLHLGFHERLTSVDVCSRRFRHPLDGVEEVLAVDGFSFYITPCTWLEAPGVVAVHREVDEAIPLFWRIKRNRDVIKRSPHVEDEIAEDPCPALVGSIEPHSVDPFPLFALGFDLTCDQVFAASRVGRDLSLEISEVFLSLVVLDPPGSIGIDAGRHKHSHGLSLDIGGDLR